MTETHRDLEPPTEVSGASPAQGFVLRLPPIASSVSVARSAIRRTVEFGNDDLASRFLTALSEIIVNAIEAHQRLDDPTDVAVTVDFANPALVIVRNHGDGDGVELSVAPISHTGDMTDERGRGLLMASTLVPDVRIEATADLVVATLPLDGFGAPL